MNSRIRMLALALERLRLEHMALGRQVHRAQI